MLQVSSVDPVSAITIWLTTSHALARHFRKSSPPFFTIIESPSVGIFTSEIHENA
jgi:hypothetical protein